MNRLTVLNQRVALSDLGPTCTPLQTTFLWVTTSPDTANLLHFAAALPRFEVTSSHRRGCRTIAVSAVTREGGRWGGWGGGGGWQ